jgi:signal transduction histidine kinase
VALQETDETLTGDDAGDHGFLSMAPAGRAEWRLALSTMAGLAALFAIAAPFAGVLLARVDAFIPAYQSATAINDLITAVLLLGQYGFIRARALLALASGYLFTAMLAVLHALSFPGLITPTGWLGAGPQTTAWLFVFWHSGLPLAVMAYVLLKASHPRVDDPSGPAWPAVLGAIVSVAAVVAAVVLLSTVGESWLPVIILDNKTVGWMPLRAACLLSVIALAALWMRRPLAVLDLWLMVVMCASAFEVALTSLLNVGRFYLGFYAGRMYGLFAASFVLVVLLLETSMLYGRAARAFRIERRERERRLRELQSELVHLGRVSKMGEMVTALSHEVNQPIAAITNYIRAGELLTERGETEKGLSAFRKAAEQATRCAEVVRRVRGFLTKEKSETSGRRLESLANAIEEAQALALLAPGGAGVTIKLQLDPIAAEAVIDKVQIQQVLLNLTRNAAEAMSESPVREVVISTAALADRSIEVRVADTGPGLAVEVRAKLFKPFVSTKTNGMGVGLSICRTIVDAHGGRMWASDNPRGGTIFHFTLPPAEAEAGAAAR